MGPDGGDAISKVFAAGPFERWNEKAPVPQVSGIGRFTHLVFPVRTAGGMALRRASVLLTDATLAFPSRLPLPNLSLPGATPYNPLQPIIRMGNLCYIA